MKNPRITAKSELAKSVAMTEEERQLFESGLLGMVDNLNKNVKENMERKK